MAESAQGDLEAEVPPTSGNSLNLPTRTEEPVKQGTFSNLSEVLSPPAPPVETFGPVWHQNSQVSYDTQNKSAMDLEAATSDLKPLLNLLEKPPGEVAGWAIEQVRDLSQAETLVESTPIFKVATAIREAPAEQKEALVTSLFQGVGDLPVQERAEAIRLFSKLSTMSPSDPSPSSRATAFSIDSGFESGNGSFLGANFTRVATEAAITEMPPEELAGLTDVVHKESQGLVQPFIDAVPELDEEDRKRVTESLVSKGLVSEDNRVILEETIKPGGHADQFADFIWWCKAAYGYSWLIWAIPSLEGAISVHLAWSECKLPASTWIIVDCILGAIVALAFGSVRYIVNSTYKEFCDDALGTLKRLQAAHAEGKLGEAIPGVKLAAIAFGTALLFMVFGAIWACVGVSFLFKSLWASCPALQRLTIFLVCSEIALFRFCLAFAFIVYFWKAYRKVQLLKNQSSEPLLPENSQNYGAVAAQ